MTALDVTPVTHLAAAVYEAAVDRGGVALRVVAVGTDAATVEDARDRLLELLDRFDAAGSGEVARANRAAGHATPCTLETALLGSLLRDDAAAPVDVDLEQPAITVAAGHRLLPGALGVALAIDMVVHDLVDDGVTGACVQVDDAARAVGTAPYPAGWPVGCPGRRLQVPDGAVVSCPADPSGGRRPVIVVADTAWQAAVAAAGI